MKMQDVSLQPVLFTAGSWLLQAVIIVYVTAGRIAAANLNAVRQIIIREQS